MAEEEEEEWAPSSEESGPLSPMSAAEDSGRHARLSIFQNPPTLMHILRSTAINLLLPFINGVMLGFGEIFAHEIAFKWGWRAARVRFLLLPSLVG